MFVPSKEMFHVAGDAPDPAGTDLRGVSPGYRLDRSAIGRPLVFWRDLVLSFDVYQVEGQPLEIHLLCPLCAIRNHGTGRKWALRITGDRKAIDYDPAAVPPVPPGFTAAELAHHFPGQYPCGSGLLSVARFECTWEEVPELERSGSGIVAGRCSWRVAIDRNIARDV